MPLQRLPVWRLLLLFLTLVLLPAAPPSAQDSSWEGNAAVVRKGEFASAGLFAASDSFPQGTLLQVENTQNGKAVQVTVVERIDGRGTVFLLLSEQAAAVLGLPSSEVIRVKARVLIASVDTARPGSREPTASRDPDLNPAAAVPPEAVKPAPAPAAPAPAAPAPVAPAPAAPAAPAPVAPAPTPAPEAAPEVASLPAQPPPAAAPVAPPLTPAPQPPEQPAVSAPPPAAPPAPETTAPQAPAPEAEFPETEAGPLSPTAAPEPSLATPEPAVEPGLSAETFPATPPAEAVRPEERRLEELASRIPQKRLFQPPEAPIEEQPAPREPEIAAPAAAPETPPPAEPAEPALAAPQPAAQAPSIEAPQPAEAVEPELPEEPAIAAPAPGPEPVATEPPLAEPEPAAAPVTEELPVAEPAPEVSAAPAPEPAPGPGPEPAPAAPEPEIQAPEAPAVAVVPATEAQPAVGSPEPAAATPLARKSYYLQLGAYSTRVLAEKLASQVASYARYSVEILPSNAGAAPLYKVLIGPLNRDESGTLLYQFRARGFRDAFVQYIE